MLGEGGTPLEKLQAAVREFLAEDDDRIDPKPFRVVIDALEGKFAGVVRRSQERGDHLASGMATTVSWLSRTCGMSPNSVADRLCVGKHLESLPRIAAALSSGEISYQSASVLCHLREQLDGDKRQLFIEDEMLGHARTLSVYELRVLCRVAHHVADPDGFYREAEENFTHRRLHISQMPDGMHLIDGVLDPVGGAALKTATTPWPSGWVLTTSAPPRSGERTRWSSWWSTR